jgi:hypothetical protein
MINLDNITQGERGIITFTWKFPANLTSPATIQGATITGVASNLDTGDITAITGTLTGTNATTVTWQLSDGDSGTPGTYSIIFKAIVTGVDTYTAAASLTIVANPSATAVQNPLIVGVTAAIRTALDAMTAVGAAVLAAEDEAAGRDAIGAAILSDYSNVVVVLADGRGDHTTLSAAMVSIVDASAVNRYAVHVFGDVAESVPVVAKSHVDVYGFGARITMTSTTTGSTINMDSITDATWRDITVIRAGEIPNGVNFVYGLLVDGTCDDSVRLINIDVVNLCTPVASADHFAGLVVQSTAAALINCTGTGSSTAQYGHGLWFRAGAATAINCIGRGGDNGTIQNNWGIYMTNSPAPLLIGCTGYGSNAAANGYGIFMRGAATPTMIYCIGRGGDGGNGSNGLFVSESAAPIVSGGIFQGGIGGVNSHGFVTGARAAGTYDGFTIEPRRFAGEVTVTETTTFVASADVAHQIWGVTLTVGTPGTGGATLSLGTTPGGAEIINAAPITSAVVSSPAIVWAGNEVQLAAGATLYVTITGTGSPSVRLNFQGEYAPAACYGISLGGAGATIISNARVVGNCNSSYALVIGAAARDSNKILIKLCHFEARRKSTGRGAAIFTNATYDPAPIYMCTILGAATNIVPAAGTAAGTNVMI